MKCDPGKRPDEGSYDPKQRQPERDAIFSSTLILRPLNAVQGSRLLTPPSIKGTAFDFLSDVDTGP